MYLSSSFKYKKQVKKYPKMTCVIGGKCTDGVVLIADKKISYYDQPSEYREKIHMDYCPIVTSAAGSAERYNDFRRKIIPALQSQSNWTNIQVSGVIQMYTSKTDSFSSCQQKIMGIIRDINKEKRQDDEIELLVAAQVEGSGALLTYLLTYLLT
jgi:Proteasome subunit